MRAKGRMEVDGIFRPNEHMWLRTETVEWKRRLKMVKWAEATSGLVPQNDAPMGL